MSKPRQPEREPLLEVFGDEALEDTPDDGPPEEIQPEGSSEQNLTYYKLLAENIKDLIWIMDMNLNYTYISPSVEHIRGYTPEEAMQLPLEQSTTPESLAKLMTTLEQELQTGAAGYENPSYSQIVEFEVCCKNGSTIWMEGNMTFVRDASGKPVQIVGVAREISERKRAEQTSRKWTQIFESARWGVAVVTPDKYLVELANPAFTALYGYTANDMIGLSLMDLFPIPERGSAGHALADAAEDGHRRFESTQARSDGSTFPALLDVTTVKDDDDRISFFVIHTEDLSEHKRAEKAVRAAARMEATATLAGGISHDFNNIMMAVLGNASLARLELGDGNIDSASRLLEEIERAAQKAGALSHQMLAYARGGKYQPRIMNLNDSVKDVLKVQERKFPRDLSFDVNLASDLACVSADPTQIAQLVLNLLTNAVEAVAEGGSVSITTGNETVDDSSSNRKPEQLPACYVTLTVSDTGTGMDEATMSRVFEPFFSTKDQGRGLGLAAVYGIVKHHDGHVSASSQKGRGAEFKVYLPAVEAQTNTRLPQKVQTCSGSETVLVVDDDDLVINATKGLLEHYGYHVLCASNGKEAVDLASSYEDEIQVAILDMGMPVMNGSDAFPLLMAAKPALKIIIASGYELDAAAQRLLDSGASAFLHKPFLSNDLGMEIRRVLSAD